MNWLPWAYSIFKGQLSASLEVVAAKSKDLPSAGALTQKRETTAINSASQQISLIQSFCCLVFFHYQCRNKGKGRIAQKGKMKNGGELKGNKLKYEY